MTTGRTVKTLRSTHSAQVLAPRIFGREPVFKIHKIFRVLPLSEYNYVG
jgi:hypothetical protein